jgi:hypothetical protein
MDEKDNASMTEETAMAMGERVAASTKLETSDGVGKSGVLVKSGIWLPPIWCGVGAMIKDTEKR